MKRLFFSLTMISLLLFGCANKTDAVSQKVIDDIEAIGSVSLDDEEAIQKVYELYNTLTDEQKKQVTNYIVLVEDMEELDNQKKMYATQVEETLRQNEIDKEKAQEYLEKMNSYVNIYSSDIKDLLRVEECDGFMVRYLADKSNNTRDVYMVCPHWPKEDTYSLAAYSPLTGSEKMNMISNSLFSKESADTDNMKKILSGTNPEYTCVFDTFYYKSDDKGNWIDVVAWIACE